MRQTVSALFGTRWNLQARKPPYAHTGRLAQKALTPPFSPSNRRVTASPVGTSVIREVWALQVVVIPAKPGIYSAGHWKCAADGLDSRFRGNDQCFEGEPIPNDTNTWRYTAYHPYSRTVSYMASKFSTGVRA